MLLEILESLNISVNRDDKYASLIGDRIDIGLNLISLKKGHVVGELIRCTNPEKKPQNSENYKDFFTDHLELSEEAMMLLENYKKTFPEVFAALEKRHSGKGPT